MRTILFLVRKEYLQVFRDRPTLFQIFFIPFVQLLVLSNAATFEVSEARMHVVDFDRSSSSRGLVEHMAASGRFVVTSDVPSMNVANDALLGRRVNVILQIPRHFERDLMKERSAPVQIVLNAEEGAAAGIVQSYASEILSEYSQTLGTRITPRIGAVREGAEAAPRRGDTHIDIRTRGWYNPTLNYKHYMVPGILVTLVTIIGTLLTAQNIAREKELGTLEQLNVTPITRGQFIAGKLIPFWILAMVIFAMGLALGRFVFGIPMLGSLPLVFLSAAVYLVAALGIGLWISTVTSTQQQTMFVSFFILMIYMLMSGLYTPIDSMPTWAQWAAELNPVKHFIVIMRAVLVKGAGFEAVRAPLAVLAVFGTVVFSAAVMQYRKTTA